MLLCKDSIQLFCYRPEKLYSQRVELAVWYILSGPKYLLRAYHTVTWTLWDCAISARSFLWSYLHPLVYSGGTNIYYYEELPIRLLRLKTKKSGTETINAKH